jgi:hypothetical protein
MLTLSGRSIPNPPAIRLDSSRKAANDIKRIEAWLLTNAIAEAKTRGDDYNLTWMIGEKPGKLPPATVDNLNVYLFGTTLPEITA